MAKISKALLAGTVVAGFLVLLSATASSAQVQRYEPGRPTVSPYLNLFRDNRNGSFNNALPNYYSLVRPQLQQNQTNQLQQQALQQQGSAIGQIQGNVQLLQTQQQTGPLVAPTGHGSWFENPGTRTKFRDTSRYYSRVGTAGLTPRQ